MERPPETLHVLPGESLGLARLAPAREYHVTFDGRHWNVATCDGELGPSSFDRNMAITLAIRAAQHDHADGLDVAVSVEEQDGSFILAWASA